MNYQKINRFNLPNIFLASNKHFTHESYKMINFLIEYLDGSSETIKAMDLICEADSYQLFDYEENRGGNLKHPLVAVINKSALKVIKVIDSNK